MSQGFWRVYKTKVLQALGGELQEEELQDESENPQLVETTDSILLSEEGLNSVSQLARRVQGAGAKGWRTMSSLFNREDEDQLLAPEPSADHPLAVKPAEESAEKKTAGLWDVFATKWQQTSALEKMTAEVDPREEMVEGSGGSGVMPAEEVSDLGHDNDLREAEGVAFKWSFLTNKLAELKNKNIPKDLDGEHLDADPRSAMMRPVQESSQTYDDKMGELRAWKFQTPHRKKRFMCCSSHPEVKFNSWHLRNGWERSKARKVCCKQRRRYQALRMKGLI